MPDWNQTPWLLCRTFSLPHVAVLVRQCYVQLTDWRGQCQGLANVGFRVMPLFVTFQGTAVLPKTKTELRGPSPRTNYTNWATTPWRTKLVPSSADRVCHVVRVTDHYARILDFLYRNRYFFVQAAPIVLRRLSGPRSRPTTSQKI
jgi:hypothetical protein